LYRFESAARVAALFRTEPGAPTVCAQRAVGGFAAAQQSGDVAYFGHSAPAELIPQGL
jgi:hypothetical protein